MKSSQKKKQEVGNLLEQLQNLFEYKNNVLLKWVYNIKWQQNELQQCSVTLLLRYF